MNTHTNVIIARHARRLTTVVRRRLLPTEAPAPCQCGCRGLSKQKSHLSLDPQVAVAAQFLIAAKQGGSERIIEQEKRRIRLLQERVRERKREEENARRRAEEAAHQREESAQEEAERQGQLQQRPDLWRYLARYGSDLEDELFEQRFGIDQESIPIGQLKWWQGSGRPRTYIEWAGMGKGHANWQKRNCGRKPKKRWSRLCIL